MGTKLDQLLRDVDPSRTIEPVRQRVNDAINLFPIHSVAMTDEKACRELLARLFVQIECRILCVRLREVDLKFDWSRCCNILKKTYGPEPHYVAIHRILTGTDGGLLKVIERLGTGMAEEYARNEIGARISRYWRSLTVEEKLTDPKDFLRSWGHLYPLSIREDGGARLQTYFPQYLEDFPFILYQHRTSGRLTRG